MIKMPQLIMGIFFGMLGLAMIIHFWGDFGIKAIVSDLVGLSLVLMGTFNFYMYIKQRRDALK